MIGIKDYFLAAERWGLLQQVLYVFFL